jgi:8-oxo-dGTP diphosphatase
MVYKYCPQCKSKLRELSDFFCCTQCKGKIYKNSKPCAGVLPVKNGKVLLTKRAIEPYKGAFDVIGGFLNDGEDSEKGAIREAKEETGLDVRLIELLGIYIDRYGKDGDFTLNIHYVGEIVGGKIEAGDDVASLHWVPIEKTDIKEGFKNSRQSLRDLRKWYKKSLLP